jgi:uncharacterized protein DUF3618
VTDEQERLTMPGQPPTDEDLRMDAELTRQELARTVAALGDKVDIKARAHDKVEALRHRADELTEKLPERVRPVMATAVHRPMIPLLAGVALLLVLRRLSKRR